MKALALGLLLAPQPFFNDTPLNEPVVMQDGVPYLPASFAEKLGVRVEGSYLATLKGPWWLTPGQLQAGSVKLPHPPLLINQQLYLPALAFVSLGASLSQSREGDKIVFRQRPAELQRLQFNGDKLIVSLSGPVGAKLDQNGNKTTLTLLGAATPEGFHPPGPAAPFQELKLQQATGQLQLSLTTRFRQPVRLLRDGNKLELEAVGQFERVQRQSVSDGAIYEHLEALTAQGPLQAHLLTIDPGKWRLKPQLALSPAFSRKPTSQLVQQTGALAAINGGYFAKDLPAGLFVEQGMVVASPLYNRSWLGLPDRGTPFIARAQLSAAVTAPDGESAEFDTVNFPRVSNGLALFTTHFGPSTGTHDGLEAACLKDGTIVETGSGNLSIPAGGYVVSAHGAMAFWLSNKAQPGKRLTLTPKLLQLWDEMPAAIGGGPRLLENGKVSVTALDEQFKPDITNGRAPRTAVGIKEDGKVILIVVDGRKDDFSVGLTLTELAQFLQRMGAVDAINLDGGGSSTFVLKGRVTNRPSDGHERPVSNALLVVPARP